MRRKEQGLFISLLIMVALTLGAGYRAQANQTIPVIKIHTVVGQVPDESAVKALVGDITLGSISPAAADGNAKISDRILDGLQAALTGLAVEHGRSIVWGFKFQQGSEQSVIIYDASAKLLLAAIVSDIVRVDDGIEATLVAYHKRAAAAGLKPQVIVFAHSKSDLDAAFPLFKRWLQANLLGFNVDCSKTPTACDLAMRVAVPTKAFITRSGGKGLAKTALPTGSAAAIPLVKFVQ